jgi:hypothetical protein
MAQSAKFSCSKCPGSTFRSHASAVTHSVSMHGSAAHAVATGEESPVNAPPGTAPVPGDDAGPGMSTSGSFTGPVEVVVPGGDGVPEVIRTDDGRILHRVSDEDDEIDTAGLDERDRGTVQRAKEQAKEGRWRR